MAYSDDAKYVDLYDKANAAIKVRQAAEADMAFARSKYGGDSTQFKTAQARYNTAKPAADAAESARLARKKEIDDAAKAEKTKKATAKAATSAKADTSVLQYQLQQAKDKGDTAAVTALTTKLTAAQNTAAGKPSTIKKPADIVDNANPLSKYTIEPSGAVNGPGGGQVYLTTSIGLDGKPTTVTHGSIAEARAEFLKGYAGLGQMDVLKQELLAKHYINAKDIAAGDLQWVQKGVDTLISKFTYDATAAVQFGGAKDAPIMATWLKSSASAIPGTASVAGTKSAPSLDLTTIGDAATEIDNFMLDSVGRNATKEEKDAYFKKINALELASPITSSTTTDANGNIVKSSRTGAYVTPEERTTAMVSIVQGALKGTDANALLSSAKGSKIAVDISTLQANSAAYGHSLTPGEAYAIVQQGFGQKDYVAKQVERMRLNSMTMYGNLKQHITDGGTVKDIADQYATLKARKLGITIPDSLADKDVMSAITQNGGLMSTADFTRQMQANPLWRQTEEAHNTAADFANTILKSFGFMG